MNIGKYIFAHVIDFTPCYQFDNLAKKHNADWNLHPEPIRMVAYHDSVTGNDADFIANNFEASALEVANLYRHRWDIEVFFKRIKQNIVDKISWGYSENAVRTIFGLLS